MDVPALLAEVLRAVEPLRGSGVVADYIPGLAAVDPSRLGIAYAGVDGQLHGVGDWRVPFSIQSISKVFTLALALAAEGTTPGGPALAAEAGASEPVTLWQRVSREPSGSPFNSLVQLEYESGIPRNPFINAGALVVTDQLLGLTGDVVGALLDLVRAESGNPGIAVDRSVADSEADHSHRNASLAHLLADYGNLRHPVPEVMGAYVDQCAITVSCADLALAGLFLARGGIRADGSRLLSRSDAKRINAVMLTCGTYDAAGEFAYRVGLPGKSGVGGGILAVIPGRCTVAVWSPGLGRSGNSLAGVAALDELTTRTGWSIF